MCDEADQPVIRQGYASTARIAAYVILASNIAKWFTPSSENECACAKIVDSDICAKQTPASRNLARQAANVSD